MPDSECWLTTTRLGLRRFTLDDLEWLVDLYRDVEVTRHLGGTKDRAQVDELLNVRILRYYDDHPGLGIWMTLDRATGERLGFHVLNHVQGETVVQVGFILLKPAWGRGVATEMALPLLRHGFVDLGLDQIIGIANLDNHASQHVLSKIGLRRGADRAWAHPAYSAAGPMAYFEREREEWMSEHS